MTAVTAVGSRETVLETGPDMMVSDVILDQEHSVNEASGDSTHDGSLTTQQDPPTGF